MAKGIGGLAGCKGGASVSGHAPSEEVSGEGDLGLIEVGEAGRVGHPPAVEL